MNVSGVFRVNIMFKLLSEHIFTEISWLDYAVTRHRAMGFQMNFLLKLLLQ